MLLEVAMVTKFKARVPPRKIPTIGSCASGDSPPATGWMTGRRVGGLDRVDHHVMALAEFVPDSPLEEAGFELTVPP
jgi:hypothetical protein